MTKADLISRQCLLHVLSSAIRSIPTEGLDTLIAFVRDNKTLANVTVLPLILRIATHRIPIEATWEVASDAILNVSISHDYGIMPSNGVVPCFHVALMLDGNVTGWAVGIVVSNGNAEYTVWRYNKIISV